MIIYFPRASFLLAQSIRRQHRKLIIIIIRGGRRRRFTLTVYFHLLQVRRFYFSRARHPRAGVIANALDERLLGLLVSGAALKSFLFPLCLFVCELLTHTVWRTIESVRDQRSGSTVGSFEFVLVHSRRFLHLCNRVPSAIDHQFSVWLGA